MSDNSEPAFARPASVNARGDHEWGSTGLSMRDYFAGHALVGSVQRMAEVQGLGSDTFPQNVAAHAYKIADAMLKERAK